MRDGRKDLLARNTGIARNCQSQLNLNQESEPYINQKEVELGGQQKLSSVNSQPNLLTLSLPALKNDSIHHKEYTMSPSFSKNKPRLNPYVNDESNQSAYR